MAIDTQYRIGAVMFLIHNNEFRSGKIKRIVIDEQGQHYVFIIDNTPIERSVKEIAPTKEDLFNLLVDKHTARRGA